ncbi:uncharacterized protein LOC133201890 [Saccostrea echinata]|uniref:uncharacterized protein LOC133201890 n=1 Tax=Saccostrea echinata TaxID=191078 RepID=UPI002A7FDDC6|nr:uncharacterized protein LOC133201890 [Saccostrea echinata]
MSGEISGLQRRVRHISPHCLYINCRNHLLALCLKHLMPTYSSLKDVDSVLLSLWKLFEYSPRRLTMFQEDLQEMYVMKSYALVKAMSTRWLSLEIACGRVIDRYGTIIDILDEIYDEKKQPEIYRIRFCLTQQNTVAMMMLLCDVLKPLSHLSVYLQGEYVNFTHIGTHVRHANDTLHDIIQKVQRPEIDPELKFSKIQELFDEITDRTQLAMRRKNLQHTTPDDFLRTIGVPFIYSLIAEVEDAFRCTPVLQALGILDPRNLPKNIQEIPGFGDDEMDRIANFYGNPKEDTFMNYVTRCGSDLNAPVKVCAEFKAFKHQMFIMSIHP